MFTPFVHCVIMLALVGASFYVATVLAMTVLNRRYARLSARARIHYVLATVRLLAIVANC